MHIMCMNCRARRCVGTVVHEEVGDGTKNLLSAGLRDRRAMRPTRRAVRTCGWVDMTCGGIKEAMASHDKEGATAGRRSRSRILTRVRGSSSQIFVDVVFEIRPVITLTRVRGHD
jgi:hypothetical protein